MRAWGHPLTAMANYFVSTAGNNTNAGTLAAPWLTLTFSLTQLVAGDTLSVRGGTFIENLTSTMPQGSNWTTLAINVSRYSTEEVWVRPSGGAMCLRFDGQTYHIWTGIGLDGINLTDATAGALQFNAGNNIRYRDAEIKNAFWCGVATSQSNGFGTAYELINLEIHDNGRSTGGAASHGIYFSSSSGASTGLTTSHLVERCTIYNNTRFTNTYGIQIWGDVAGTDRLGGIVMRRNLIRNNANGIYAGDAVAVPQQIYNNILRDNDFMGLDVGARSSGTLVANNTVDGNGDFGITVGQLGLARNIQLVNNAITANTQRPIRVINTDTGSYASIRSNNFNGNSLDSVLDENGLSTLSSNSTTAPGYVNAATNDFHLAPASQNIDAGSTVTEVTNDFDGVARPQGAGYDIGGYEFVGSTGARISQYPVWQLMPLHSPGLQALSVRRL